DERDRILAVRLEADRLDDVTLHGRAAGALEREELAVAEAHVAQAFGVEARDLAQALAAQVGHVEVGRLLVALARDEQRFRADVEAADDPVADELADLAARDVDREQRVLAVVVAGRVQRAAVGRKLRRRGRTIPVRRDLALLAALEVERPDPE